MKRLTKEGLRRMINESLSDNEELVRMLTESFRQLLEDEWDYNDKDPSMADLGHAAWFDQLDDAVNEFAYRVTPVVDDVVDKLIGGEYHRG